MIDLEKILLSFASIFAPFEIRYSTISSLSLIEAHINEVYP
jgi:hypothetical protein